MLDLWVGRQDTARAETDIPRNKKHCPDPGAHDTMRSRHNLAVLRAKVKIKNFRIRAGIGPNPAMFLWKMAVRTLPRDPPGEGGPRKNMKIVLSTARNRAGNLPCF